jgi:hypothetical protein
LIAAGSFWSSGSTPVNLIARWDGVSWSPLGEGVGQNLATDAISAMVVYNGDLIVAGDFTIAGPHTVDNIARWDGNAWHSMDGGLTGSDAFTGVRALAVHEGSLFVGGHFEIAGEIPSLNIARWDD